MAHSIPGNRHRPICRSGTGTITDAIPSHKSFDKTKAQHLDRGPDHIAPVRTTIAEDKAIRSGGHFMVPFPALNSAKLPQGHATD